jgi:dolichol-phosphate mannosyltransferase
VTDRQVPEHIVEMLGPRRHDHALVIPVINEGERIRAQLARVAAIMAPVDVIIADGGSTDGSLALDFLRSVGVRTLLVKTGSGRLSAQLHMAYSVVVDEGYKGVITIDGNGKDDVGPIPRFVDKLVEGYDYVQASRYRPGGEAINTPRDRHLAGRFIHAPLISLASGRWLTDTTNGFRGYSARYLTDMRVQPFRNVFENYNLLFYLSVRAGQLGFRTTEIPVSRRYPVGEPTPTKISGMRGRGEMMIELLRTVAGGFHPAREGGP